MAGGNPTAEYVSAVAGLMLEAIHADMSKPFPWGKQIPRDVGGFSALHDYCDANEYAARWVVPNPAGMCSCSEADWAATWVHPLECPTQSPVPVWWEGSNDSYTVDNAVMDEVDRRLQAEAEGTVLGVDSGERRQRASALLL